MTPPVSPFPACELPWQTELTPSGKRRKGFSGEQLRACELLELLQYRCEVEDGAGKEARARCWPVERLFRRCKDAKGTFMVETTAWEGRDARAAEG